MKFIWQAEIRDDHLFLGYLSPDGDGGYPGAVQANVTIRLTQDNTLVINYTATVARKATPINLSAHPYFNLGGHVIMNLDYNLFITQFIQSENIG